jgi:hypothetical protein
MTTTRAPAYGVTDLGRAEVAYQVQQAGNWRPTAGKSDARVLATEYRRIGKIMRELLTTPDRIEITSQVVSDYMRVLTALNLARAIDAGADTKPPVCYICHACGMVVALTDEISHDEACEYL